MLLLAGCGLPSNVKLTTQCVVGQDQAKTFLGKWELTPVKMALGQDAVTDVSQDKAVVDAAMKIWNGYSNYALGKDIIDYQNADGSVRVDGVSPVARLTLCSYNILSEDKNSFLQPVMIHKRADWPYDSGIIALTTSCPVRGTPNFKVSMIEINVRDFFADGKPQPDATSILVHEVGHMLGLVHTCESGSKDTGIPDCNKTSSLPLSYRRAVMFPEFAVYQSGSGEVRSKLNSNDVGRANCLYK